ncbi:hypothetical protein [Haladaptatus salinisoli]|uniref:hypothetical protein n=1 Tax=Haladaptatus salinisoli TaxID=2884876 RepID=UPI001D0A377A|nr:hypothetical protein [Haladaptatus salinisoli]
MAVERSRIDCNRSATDVAVAKDGIESATVTTLPTCRTTTARAKNANGRSPR